jgi:hypothetical protein
MSSSLGIALGVGAGILVAGALLLGGLAYVLLALDSGGTAAVSRVIMSAQEFEALKIGTPFDQVERQFGAGSGNDQGIPEPRGVDRCTYYDPTGDRVRPDAFQLCFEGGLLRQRHRVDTGSGSAGGGFD